MAQSLTLLAQDSPRSGHLHVLPLDCRPRGFSPPRRFRLHDRSGIVAPQPDRIRTVASSLLGLSPKQLDLDHRSPVTRNSTPKPAHRTLPRSPPSQEARFSCSPHCPSSEEPRQCGPMDVHPSETPPKRNYRDLWVVRKSPFPVRVHPSKNITPAQPNNHLWPFVPPRRCAAPHRWDSSLDLEAFSPCGRPDPRVTLP